jgi:hypothetical protein
MSVVTSSGLSLVEAGVLSSPRRRGVTMLLTVVLVATVVLLAKRLPLPPLD